MKVYNLTNSYMVYKNKTLAPNGGFSEFDIAFIPDRDKALATAGKLAFGSLPKGWKPVKTVEEVAVVEVPIVSEPKIEDKVVLKVESKEDKGKKK